MGDMILGYARLVDRVKAGILDVVLLFTLIYSVSEILSIFEHDYAEKVRILTYILFFCCYEPLLVSFYGGTLGHSLSGIEVKKESNTQKNIAIHWSFLRYIIKLLLGWVSFVSILFSSKSKAIHDYAEGSVVIEKLEN